ncbi:MAG: response regulator [Spirochaetota bacterium]
MKKILVIDESTLVRNYLVKKLEEYGFEVAVAVNGLDGASKLRSETPDLVIMDYFLSRTSSIELLEKKKADPNVAHIPVIMASTKIDRQKLVQVSKYNVKKFFTKPIRIDSLLKTVSELLGVEVTLDDSPCIIEAHFNDEILFIEVAEGLNKEKIELLRYKIEELLDLYQVRVPKVLLMMVGVDITANDSLKLATLLNTVIEYSRAKPRDIKILTNNDFVTRYVGGNEDYKDIEVTNALDKAITSLLGGKAGDVMDQRRGVVQDQFLQASSPRKEGSESFQMKFEGERLEHPDLAEVSEGRRIIVVDDDMVIRELIKAAFSDTKFEIETYEDGRTFVENADVKNADLVFLDLMMPEMNGFEVLKVMKERQVKVPIIVLSALSKRESVVEALKFGVKSYVIKPLKPEWIRKKATEVLALSF